MKLYLSSIGVPDSDTLLALIKPGHLSVSIIPNAWDVYPEERAKRELEDTKKLFTKLGFTISVTDLKTTTNKKLKAELLKNSLVWVMGGNSFYLNQIVHESGMADFIAELLKRGLVYGGTSAGAVLACPTLHGIELLDDPKKAPSIIWAGLNLVDFGILPHWGMEKYGEQLEECKKRMERVVPVKTITNNQAVVVHDGNVRIVGE